MRLMKLWFNGMYGEGLSEDDCGGDNRYTSLQTARLSSGFNDERIRLSTSANRT